MAISGNALYLSASLKIRLALNSTESGRPARRQIKNHLIFCFIDETKLKNQGNLFFTKSLIGLFLRILENASK